MPAIRLAALRQELAHCLEANTPEALAACLGELLARHGTPRFRAGQAVQRPTIPAHHVPVAGLEAIAQALRRWAASHPQDTVPLASALWAQGYLENRALAARLLGWCEREEALHQAWAWLGEAREPRLKAALLEHSLRPWASRAPQAYLALLTEHADTTTPTLQRQVLQALEPLIATPGFDYTPGLFRLLHSVLRQLHADARPEAVQALRAAATRWPYEVGPFLRRVLQSTASPSLVWVARRVLPQLPEISQKRLRPLL